jgi:fatty-acyl-CoA synthase
MKLWDVLTGHSGDQGGLHVWENDGFNHYRWDRIAANAQRTAAGLVAAGVSPGDRVATVLTNTADSVTGLLGTWMTGGTLASLPTPSRGQDFAEYREQLGTLCKRLETGHLVVDEPLVEPLQGISGVVTRGWSSLDTGASLDPQPPGPDDIAFVQFSSGSTSLPKGCSLSSRAIEWQLESLIDLLDGGPEDVGISWLPLSHDMGLFACMLAFWYAGATIYLSTPERFLANPATWFGDCAEFDATITAGPNAGIEYATRGSATRPPRKKLRLKSCTTGAERVEWETLQRAVATLGEHGLAMQTFMPAYGMAEATLGVSSVQLDEAPRFVRVDSASLVDYEVVETESEAGATTFVSTGKPWPGIEVHLSNGNSLSEIEVSSPSLASGYYGDPDMSAARFADGRFKTGDLGFVQDGEVFIVGRTDDMLSVAGRKIYAGEVEAAIAAHEEIRPGCCALIDLANSGNPRLVLLAEPRGEGHDFAELAGRICETAASRAGVTPDECIFVSKGSLPKTPTGKLQRFRCRALAESNKLDVLEQVSSR